jgi:hypothetical protein
MKYVKARKDHSLSVLSKTLLDAAALAIADYNSGGLFCISDGKLPQLLAGRLVELAKRFILTNTERLLVLQLMILPLARSCCI